MKLLAIDTSTEACSAALLIDKTTIQRYQVAPRQHAELILPMVDELLNEAGIRLQQLDALAFGRGPGAFTGIRIATGVIQGLAYAADLPIIPISSLATLAQSVASQYQYTIPAFDARMGEVYCAVYQTNQNGLVELVTEELVIKPDHLPIQALPDCFGLGSGWGTYYEQLMSRMKTSLTGTEPAVYPAAVNMLPLALADYNQANAVSPEQASPIYLRNNVTF